MQQQLVKMSAAKKESWYLVDLLSYGMVALPIVYSHGFYEQDVKCNAILKHRRQRSTVGYPSNSFTFVLSKSPNGNGYIISFQGDAGQNIYYHIVHFPKFRPVKSIILDRAQRGY